MTDGGRLEKGRRFLANGGKDRRRVGVRVIGSRELDVEDRCTIAERLLGRARRAFGKLR